MTRLLIRLLALLVLLASPASGQDAPEEEVVAGLSQNRISISTNFDGSEILIFGAIKREAPVDEDEAPVEVIVTVAGPLQSLTVRRKARVAGIWINTDSIYVDRAPSFYAVMTSAPLDDVLLNIEDLRWNISIPRAIRSVGAPETIADAPAFTEALIRIRTAKGLYKIAEGAVNVAEQTLFSTEVTLPANLVEGNYGVRIFLTRKGEVIQNYDTAIFVHKVGLERYLYNLAHEQPLVYGLLALALAGIAGWGASTIFRLIRR